LRVANLETDIISIKEITNIINPQDSDIILDVGIGHGFVSENIKSRVKEIVGVDLEKYNSLPEDITFIKGDIRELRGLQYEFDKAFSRFCFHEITDKLWRAFANCYNALKPGGKLIVCEDIPPNKTVKQDFIDIFRMKEDRLVFEEEDLVKYFEEANFKDIQSKRYVLLQQSVRQWLRCSNLPIQTQRNIFKLYLHAESYFKEAYNVTITSDEDCLIDMHFTIVSGIKE